MGISWMKLDKNKACETCRVTAYSCGAPSETVREGGPLPQMQSIYLLSVELKVSAVLHYTRHRARETSKRGRHRKVRHEIYLDFLKPGFDQAVKFQAHLMDLFPNERESHVSAAVHTPEMVEVARFLAGKQERAVKKKTGHKVLAILLGKDDLPRLWAEAIGGEPPASKTYISDAWVKQKL